MHIGTAFVVVFGKVGLGNSRYRGNKAKALIFCDFLPLRERDVWKKEEG